MVSDVKAVIEVKDLTVERANTEVVKDANLKVNKGDYVGIVGPNGGGKTTLLLSMLGALPATKGSIKIFGKDIKNFSEWDRIAYVSQDAIKFDSQFPLSVRELVSLGLANSHNLGRSLKADDWRAVDEVLEFMDMMKIKDKRIGQLSGGQKQRLFVAKALVRKPDVIFLDEPIAGVDPMTQEKFYRKLSDLNTKKGITILIVSHDLSAVFCRMSKVICVNKEVHTDEVSEDFIPDELLRKTYGDHFHFVFHKHECEGVFDNGRTDSA
jgi:zinc transport system ATP-binding protein